MILKEHSLTVTMLCKLELIMSRLSSAKARWYPRWPFTSWLCSCESLDRYLAPNLLSPRMAILILHQMPWYHATKVSSMFGLSPFWTNLLTQVLLQAQLALQDIDSALLSLTKASNIEPNDGKICKELCLVHWKLFSTYTRNVDVTNRQIHELSATC